MIIDQLVLHNVGVFRGKHTLTLTPPEPDKPVTLVGALNGGGKTTILDSLYLALFGSLARTAGRRTSSYNAYLERLIHRGIPQRDGAAVELAFHVFQEGQRRDYTVRRSWTAPSGTVRERLDILVNGTSDKLLADRWGEYVEAFTPRGIAELFFFDGEKIETLAELDNARDMLRTTIGALLGLDLVDRLATDLTIVEREQRSKQVPPGTQKLLDSLRERIAQHRRDESAALDAVAAAEGAVGRASKRLEEIETKLRLEGGELQENLHELGAKSKHLADAVGSVNQRLADLAAGPAPLLLVRSQLAQLAEHGEREIAAARQRGLADLLTARDEEILRQLRDGRVRRQAVDALADFLTTDRKQRVADAEVDPVTDLTPDGIHQINTLLEHRLDEARSAITTDMERRQRLIRDREDTERALAAAPTEQALEGLRDQRDRAAQELKDATQRQGQAEAAHKTAMAAREDSQRKFDSMLDKAAREASEAADAGRIVEHSQRVRSTLERLHAEGTRRNLHRIQTLVLESLQHLMRKDGLITELTIDPETFTIELRGRDGHLLLPQQLSAGERQLLAVSLLWGLAQASGKPLPVVIDTPLGRLDSIHRHHLITRYFPHASHQVILLSTDQEIDQPTWDILRPFIGHTYLLEHDATAGYTTVREGYFWPEPAR